MTCILIAEDTATQRLLLRRLCESIVTDPHVIAAKDTQDAIDAYQGYLADYDGPPDLVITDLSMPVKEGTPLADEAGLILTRVIHKTHHEVPILVLTAIANPELLQRCREVGAADCLQKENFLAHISLRNKLRTVLPEEMIKPIEAGSGS